MLLRSLFLTTAAAAALALLPGAAQAQLLNPDATRAQQARDSVLLTANQYRHDIEQRATRFKVRTRRLGARRRVVRGYAPKSTDVSVKLLAWKHVSRTLRNGTVHERYVGYSDGVKILQESRTNERVNLVRLSQVVRTGGIIMGRTPAGELTREGYVWWRKRQYVPTAPTKL